MVPVLIFAGLVLWLLIRSDIKTTRWMRSFDLHNDMFNKYVELVDDPLTTDNEWKSWLSIFEAVDEICNHDCPDMKFDSISSRIRSIIDDREIIED